MTRQLRVAAVVATFPPYLAGTGNVAYHQAEALAARGHEVTVITATQPGVASDPAGVAVRRARPVLRLGNAPLLPELAALRGYDVVHLHQPFIFGAELVALACRRGGIPLVTTVHNQLMADGTKGRLFDAYSATMLPLVLRVATRIIGVTRSHALSVPQIASELKRHPDKLAEVPNAVDVQRFTPGPATHVRSRYGLSDGAPVAIACAQLDHAHEFKRVDLAIEAVARLRDAQPHLIVVGGGPLRDRLAAMAEEAGVRDRVHFAGALAGDELVDHYRAADFLVLPSEIESFGLVQVEAMACGKPVIVSDVPGCRDVSVDGRHGFHVRPGSADDLTDAVRRMVNLPEAERIAMGEAALARVRERYTWPKSTDALERVLYDATPGTNHHGSTESSHVTAAQ